MPKPVSKRQYRYMQAILHGKGGTSSRGDRVPKSIAGKYAGKGGEKDLPESKGKSQDGGKWDEKGHSKAKEKVDKKRSEKKKSKKLKKGEDSKVGVGVVVTNSQGWVLLGRSPSFQNWSTPGGSKEIGESYIDAARRELEEESGLKAKEIKHLMDHHRDHGLDKTFIVTDWDGEPKDTEELADFKFFTPAEIPWDNIRDCCIDSLQAFVADRLKKSDTKSISDMLALEKADKLSKNIVRTEQTANAVHEMNHGDALRLVGNGTFRLIREATKGMTDEDFKDVLIDNYKISIRKHTNDVYSGRVSDGIKVIHQFTSKSLPELTAELMSLFEWYMPEDEDMLSMLDDDADMDIEGGLSHLVSEYEKHNIGNIYREMESVREEIRNGNAIDLQQIEHRMMSIFDSLEETVHDVAGQHNNLCSLTSNEISNLEDKLVQLQSKLEDMSKKPTTVDAMVPDLSNTGSVHNEHYPYLTKPQIDISPDGRIKITFNEDWQHMERENFLKDMKAKVVKQKG